jgi:hypothetical protein
LDTVLDGLDVIKVKDERKEEEYLPVLNTGGALEFTAYTALEEDLFLPRGIYSSDKGVPIIFDSGCTHAVTPYTEDFIGDIKPVKKLMNGLGATAEVVGEGTVLWQFRDDFGVTRRAKVPAYLVPVSKVRLFSPQSYF